MKHGVAFRKFSRTSSHRMLMLRNLVTSLVEHEQIRTTLPKARDAARLAEKLISLGKNGDASAHSRAEAFLLKPSLVPKLFSTLASRYADRPGGYTRIHKYGNRQGDNAPQAILELVDNPRDLKWEMTSRAIGREILKEKLKHQKPLSLINNGAEGIQELVKAESIKPADTKNGILRSTTRWNLQKILKFKNEAALTDISKKAGEYIDHLLATPMALRTLHEERKGSDCRTHRLKAGQTVPGETRAALDLVQGALGHRRPQPKNPLLNMRTVFGRRYKATA
ncbi:hypothetical protein AMATHDRAFT_134373 [Amanita thiersii Skay4041]|uniref:Ribosomal protein L17 n=1 Tax=Amanita thiersii Skay4041 TaxID=703135 RepID=A0A2A9P1I9_9AGAR|nr:hypothetical protein AMATHDRAFT_134373 [Amanita thiersii Skay4041]